MPRYEAIFDRKVGDMHVEDWPLLMLSPTTFRTGIEYCLNAWRLVGDNTNNGEKVE